MPHTKKIALAAAHALCSKLAGEDIIEPTEALAVVNGHVVHIQIMLQSMIETPLATPEERAASPTNAPPKLTPLMQRILGVLSKDKPTKAEVIAMKLGKNCGGSFRTLLADLVRFGVVKHVFRVGYLLA